jgi:frataxin-like iron-binding protein CyaY
MFIARRFISRIVRQTKRIPSANQQQTLKIVLPPRNKMSQDEFREVSTVLMNRINHCFHKLNYENEGSKVTSGEYESTIEFPDVGKYYVTMNPEKQTAYVHLGEGVFDYFYDADNKRWINCVDGHILEEILARELLKVCKGLPEF